MTLERMSAPDLGTGARGVTTMIDRIADIRGQIAALEAAETQTLADLGEAIDDQIAALPAKQRAAALPLRDASARLGARVRLSDRTVQTQIAQAQQTVVWFPATMAAWREGRISRSHVRVITDAGQLLVDDPARGRFEAEVLRVAEAETAARTRPFAERLAERFNPEPFAERHRRARDNRKARVRRLTDGMARLSLDIPAVLAHAAMDRANAIARLELADCDRSALRRALRSALGRGTHAGAAPGSAVVAPADSPADTTRDSLADTTRDSLADTTRDSLADATPGSFADGGADFPIGEDAFASSSVLELLIAARVRVPLTGLRTAASTAAHELIAVDVVWQAHLVGTENGPEVVPASGRSRRAARGRATMSSRETTREGSHDAEPDEPAEPAEPDERTLDQRRADVLTELLLAGVPAGAANEPIAAVMGQVQITVPVLTLISDDDAAGVEQAELEGHGPIDPATARMLTAQAPGWDRILTHPITGTVVEVDRYRPTDPQRRYLRGRDGRCRFPGCTTSARRCDQDHTVDYAKGGRTSLGNLACICGRHHTLKHHTCWQVIHRAGGVLEWRDPDGRTYTDKPPPPVAFVPQDLIERVRARNGLHLVDTEPAPF